MNSFVFEHEADIQELRALQAEFAKPSWEKLWIPFFMNLLAGCRRSKDNVHNLPDVCFLDGKVNLSKQLLQMEETVRIAIDKYENSFKEEKP